MVINLGDFIKDKIDFYKVFDFRLDLIVSAIILLVTNYKSDVSIWLILFFFIFCMIVLIVRQRNFDAHAGHINFLGVITSIFAGIFMLSVAVMHIHGLINILIEKKL